jgi:hypothetical protein
MEHTIQICAKIGRYKVSKLYHIDSKRKEAAKKTATDRIKLDFKNYINGTPDLSHLKTLRPAIYFNGKENDTVDLEDLKEETNY